MKKIIVAVAFVFATFTLAEAQNNALGFKLGNGIDISYQRWLTETNRNRWELNVGLASFGNNNPIAASGLYQWVYGIGPAFNFFFGVGAGAGLYTRNSDFFMNLLGNVGIEYNFEAPFQIALDFTPGLTLVPDPGDLWHTGSMRFAVRWRF